jgi:hypothetical protein
MRALVAEYETLAGQQDTLRGEDTNRPHVNVQGARQMVAKKQQIREIQAQMQNVKRRLLQMVAGYCPQPSGTGSAPVVNRANSHPLHISIMTEAELSQVDRVRHTELRNSCVVLMHNSANSAVTLALASNATAVEMHGSEVAVLDAAARYRASNANYFVGFSAAELQDPNSRPATETKGKDELAPGEWAAQRFGVGFDKTQPVSSPSESSGRSASAFSGLPGTAELAKRFDTPTPLPESRKTSRGLSAGALRKMAGMSADGEASVRWVDHPQWTLWPRHESGEIQDCGADSGVLQRQSSKDTEQALLLYASPAVARATRTVSIANTLLLGCWSNVGAVCKRVGEWWSEPSPAELVRR